MDLRIRLKTVLGAEDVQKGDNWYEHCFEPKRFFAHLDHGLLVITAILGAECLVGGVMGVFQLEPFVGIIRHLGYPIYFMAIHGVSYALAGIVLLIPGLPLLKEWAYAGLFFTYIGATASHLAVGDGLPSIVAPLDFAGLVCASWALRPSERRLAGKSPSRQ